ncbi:MAG: transporter substrate-binding domain-containing protein [Actinobacteria bacterium]|nr:MAG: transporter substrate-binding domain-containing protein [Actinomycetota bacterium]
MRRIAVAAASLLLAAAVFTGLGAATPGGKFIRTAAPVPLPKPKPKPAKPKLPPLPSAVKSRKHWEIGVKCDFPPFGFIDVRGNNDGYDVQVAQRFAQLAFGSKKKVSFTCVTTPSRIPTLMSGRVDIIVSTLTWTQARADQIDFSIPYYSATGRLLVPNSSSVTVPTLAGKTVVTTRGALYAAWTRNCFKSTKLLEVDSPALAVSAVKDGRADTFMFDDAFLLGVATQDRDVRLTSDKFLNVPWGIGIRKGETAMSRWVNAALRYMKKRDEFVKILRANAPARLVSGFLDNVPRPKNTFAYPVGKDVTTICP